LGVRLDGKIFLEFRSYPSQRVLLALDQPAIRILFRRLRRGEVDTAEHKSRRRLNHRLFSNREAGGGVRRQLMVVSDGTGHVATTGLNVGGIHCNVSALSTRAAARCDRDGNRTALRAAGLRMNRD